MSASHSPQLKYAKPVRHVAKVLKGRAVVRMDRTEKELVRRRDFESCRVCFRATRQVHERLFKSLGGVASLENSLCACKICHPFLQQHGIQVYGETCNDPLLFEMNEAVARIVFRGRAVPPHVTVIAGNRNGAA
jgi:hypothetical protein